METAHLIDSNSMGDPAHHRVRRELDELWAASPAAPSDLGTLALLVRRVEGGRRETPAEAILDPVSGLPGDAWERRPERKIEAQLTVMQLDIARLLANGQPLTLFGDNVFVDLDLSVRNLPIGSRIRIGEALLEVTPKPHNGCKKFHTRFGEDALRFVSDPAQRHRNFRGIYLCVIERGVAKLGDAVEVISRSGSPLLTDS